MNTLLFSFLELHSVLSIDDPEKLKELMELVEEFNLTHGTNFDPTNKSIEFIYHDSAI